MDFIEVKDEYYAAMRRGQKEQKELLAAGKAAGLAPNKDQIKRAENEISAQNNK